MVVASYHYKFAIWVLCTLAAGCASHERTTPQSTAAVVPDVVGATVEKAIHDVESAGLRVELVDSTAVAVERTTCLRGVVVRQGDPAGAELVRGSPVDLTVTSCLPAESRPSP